jgi:hypothetical protein
MTFGDVVAPRARRSEIVQTDHPGQRVIDAPCFLHPVEQGDRMRLFGSDRLDPSVRMAGKSGFVVGFRSTSAALRRGSLAQ